METVARGPVPLQWSSLASSSSAACEPAGHVKSPSCLRGLGSLAASARQRRCHPSHHHRYNAVSTVMTEATSSASCFQLVSDEVSPPVAVVSAMSRHQRAATQHRRRCWRTAPLLRAAVAETRTVRLEPRRCASCPSAVFSAASTSCCMRPSLPCLRRLLLLVFAPVHLSKKSGLINSVPAHLSP